MSALTAAIADAAKRFAALDFSAENAQIADLEGQISDIDKAMERGQKRSSEIVATLSAKTRVDPDDVADVLLDPDSDTALLSPNTDLLESERESILDGLNNLRNRRQDAVEEIARIKMDAKHSVGPQADSLAAALAERAEAAAQELLEIYAATKALNLAFNNSILIPLEQKLNFAVHGLSGQYRMAGYRAELDVPSALRDAFEEKVQKSQAFSLQLARSVQRPPTQVGTL